MSNLFGLGIDSKIEYVLYEVGCGESWNNRLWNILTWSLMKDNVITMRDLVNMSRENILNVKNLGNKSVNRIRSIFKYCGINDIKDWKDLDVTKRYYDRERNRYLEKK